MCESTKEKIKEIVGEKIQSKFVECEECGCVLFRGSAIRGESKIVSSLESSFDVCLGFCRIEPVERIKKTFYCKVHSPYKNNSVPQGLPSTKKK